jgi:HK97 family phage major capsid protein
MVGALKSESVFYKLLDAGFTRVPLRTRVLAAMSPPTGYISGEGMARPLARLSLSGPTLTPVVASAVCVLSMELWDATGLAGHSFVDRALRQAVGQAVDAELFRRVIDDTDVFAITASGATADDAVDDLRRLVSAVNNLADPNLLWVLAGDVAKAAPFLRDANGIFTFPAMSPVGGTMMGLPAVVSSALADGTIYLLSPIGIAGDSDTMIAAVSKQGSVEMEDAPLGDSLMPTATTQVSLFQTNSIGVKIDVTFACERLRDDAVAKLTGIAWEAVAS